MKRAMFKQILLCLVLVPSTVAASNSPQLNSDQRTMPVSERISEKVPNSMRSATAIGRTAEEDRVPPAQMTNIVNWLTAIFDLPANSQHPKVQMNAADTILLLRHKAVTVERQREVLAHYAKSPGREIIALYNPLTKTIHLPEGWAGRTPAEESVLVHELVHHLQHEGRLTYACTEASEELAYEAQERWLGLYGLSLESEFNLDPFTLLTKRLCPY
jgi:hypothetical protein